MHSKNFDKIKTYYENGVNNKRPAWSKEMVYNVVGKELGITESEYEEITGEEYIKK